MSMLMAVRDDDFYTRLASYLGWQMAMQSVKPSPRQTALLDLAGMVRAAVCRNAQQAVDMLLARFLSVPVDAAARARVGNFLEGELGTSDLAAAGTFLEVPLRSTLHLMLSVPEYPLG
jgi:hypothetical protein